MNQQSVLFADIVGSTSLYRELGDERAEQLVRLSLERVASVAQSHGGRLVKTIGDCALCHFDHPDAAALTAWAVQQSAQLPAVVGSRALQFRIGFSAGQVIERDNDIFGDAVNIAARLCEMAKANQILTTEVTATSLARDIRSNTRVFDRTAVKGLADILTVMQLVWDERAATQIFAIPQPATQAPVELTLHCLGRSLVLTPADLPLTIGRGENCGLVIPAPSASRLHLRIELRRGKFTLVDESTNGTYVVSGETVPEKLIYVRNEAFTLLGRGMFALGERPERDSENVITYEAL